MSMEFLPVGFELKALQATGEFEGYASVFGVPDDGGDIVEPGAFKASLGKRRVKMLWQHDMSQPIGVWDEVREDDKGLFVRGRIITAVQRGAEASALIGAGAIDSMSIGYRALQAERDAKGRRRLKEIDLYEVSVVTVPMNARARITSVKAAETEREFERFLREAGFSRSEAVAITLHGFKGLTGQRDAEAVAASGGLTALMAEIRQLQENIHV